MTNKESIMKTMTKKNCVIDARVSSDKQLQGSGVDDQETVCTYLAEKNGWNIVKIYSKSYSGRKEERGDFKVIIEDIKQLRRSGVRIHYYIVKSLDRFTRLGVRAYDPMKAELKKINVQLVDTRNTVQEDQNTLEHLGVMYDWSVISPSRNSEIAEVEKAESEVTEILTRMVGAEILYVRQGFSMRGALDGYKNTQMFIDGREYSVLENDKEREDYFKEIFEMRASFRFSDKEIVEHISAKGYKSKDKNRWKTVGKKKLKIGVTRGKPLTVKQLQKLIQRTLYAGVKNEAWNTRPVLAKFADGSRPIASIETFNRANRGKVFIRIDDLGQPEILYGKNAEREISIKRRCKYHPDYAYDKMVNCAVCKKPYKNGGKGNKGKLGTYYQAYHCDREVDGVKHYERIAKKEFETQVSHFFNNLKFSDNFMEQLEKRLIKKFREREAEILSSSVKIGENVNELKAEQETVLKSLNVTESIAVRRRLESAYEELEERIVTATEKRDEIEIQERDIKSFVKRAKELMEHPVKILGNNEHPVKQSEVFSLVFEQPPTYAEIVNGTPKLSPLFKLSEEYKTSKSQLVTLQGLGWNTIEDIILKWKYVFETVNVGLDWAESSDPIPYAA